MSLPEILPWLIAGGSVTALSWLLEAVPAWANWVSPWKRPAFYLSPPCSQWGRGHCKRTPRKLSLRWSRSLPSSPVSLPPFSSARLRTSLAPPGNEHPPGQ